MEAWSNAQLTVAFNALLNGVQVFAEALSLALPKEAVTIIEKHLTSQATRLRVQVDEQSAFVCEEIARVIRRGSPH
jgi:hypothetical protein